ncbi:hypothetical protein ACFFLS_18580 [Flavobacterium procerum]|uniref:DUF3828 domain-containing protein n=1 Tax=Flavobacterium procerum TaxID=1455569 RepID=A0ABV6BUE7_9FLAO
MIKFKLTLFLTAILLTACNQNKTADKPLKSSPLEREKVETKEDKVKNALTFINGYTDNANKMNKAVGMQEWVNSSSLATPHFKKELKRIMDEAYKEDPELGLGSDPVFDAQDNPNAFELESLDENTNYLIVKGKDWPEFTLSMKVVKVNGKWLVDGCGIVNIPNDKRRSRE